MTLHRPSGRSALGIAVTVAIAAFLAFAYGWTLTYALVKRVPAIEREACGDGFRLALVPLAAIEPVANPGASDRRAVWFACADGFGAVASGRALHDRMMVVAVSGSFAVFLVLIEALRVLGRRLFSGRTGADGRALPSPAERLWGMVPPRHRHRVAGAAFGAIVAAGLALVPTGVVTQNLYRMPAVAGLFCESGRVSPWGYSHPGETSRFVACEDAHGRPIADDATHFRIVQSIFWVSFLVLFAAIFPLAAGMFGAGSVAAGMTGRAARRS